MPIFRNQQMSPVGRFIMVRLFPLPFFLIGAFTLFFGVRGIIRAHESTSWPTVPGTIRHSSVEYHLSSGRHGGSTWGASIRYEFAVDGVTHSGNRVAYGDYGSSDSSHAQSIVNRYPVNQPVTIHYMPSDPDESLLEPGIQAQSFFLPVFGLVFFTAGTLMLVFLPRAISRNT